MKFTLDGLKRRKVLLDDVTIHSYDMSLYLVELSVGQHTGMLCSEDGRPLHFRSVEQVKNSLSEFVVNQVLLRHESPFDEMIGNPESAKQPLIVPLSW
ncbi:Na(+)-translocating NADH-quinone reductase subunit B [Alteromonadaceae bacterium M269]|nr:Na(+)-translocating NADH-quinone reductase subunit B [Alteromonadaceae bacterium M269]